MMVANVRDKEESVKMGLPEISGCEMASGAHGVARCAGTEMEGVVK
jgi:hypothetical protein